MTKQKEYTNNKLTEMDKCIIRLLNHPVYTVEFCEQWLSRPAENVLINAPAAIQKCCVEAFIACVRSIQEAKLGPRHNEGYTITQAITIGDTEYVLGELESEKHSMYVTWACKNDYYYWGHYFQEYHDAVDDLLTRAVEAQKFVKLGTSKKANSKIVCKEGICPLCGADLEYGESEDVDDGVVILWECPECGATGKEGYDLVFDGNHYDVRNLNGETVDLNAPAQSCAQEKEYVSAKYELADSALKLLNKTIEEASYATWESLRVEIPLTAPYPSSHVLSVSGDYDAAGKKTFTVEISSKDYITIERSYSKSMAEKDVNQAVYLALDSMSELPLENVWTDADLEAAWECFGDIPMNPETECMERSFLHFPMGTHREEIWHWFDARYSKGVCALLSPCSDNDEENG